MKVRLLIVAMAVVGLVGAGAAPVTAAPSPDVCPIYLYPYCN